MDEVKQNILKALDKFKEEEFSKVENSKKSKLLKKLDSDLRNLKEERKNAEEKSHDLVGIKRIEKLNHIKMLDNAIIDTLKLQNETKEDYLYNPRKDIEKFSGELLEMKKPLLIQLQESINKAFEVFQALEEIEEKESYVCVNEIAKKCNTPWHERNMMSGDVIFTQYDKVIELNNLVDQLADIRTHLYINANEFTPLRKKVEE